MTTVTSEDQAGLAPAVTIRPATEVDLGSVTSLDARNTGMAKPDFWAEAFVRYGRDGEFLVAERDGAFLGYIVGEVRAWEFGSPPCGWIFAFGVEPEARLGKVASRLFGAICERFRVRGVDKVRSMVATDDLLNLAFLRAQGMRGGPYLQLEMPLGSGEEA
jgi:ribosomal protein S18 acetylase RimI-like enzyme